MIVMTPHNAPHLRPLADDTSPEARAVLAEVYRDMPPGRKAAIASRLGRMTRALFAAGYRAKYPDSTDDEIVEAWMQSTLEPALFEAARRVRRECIRRRLGRSTEGGEAAIEHGNSLCFGRLDGQFDARGTAFHE
jgi:hypothetical protein